jgi:hypothetical protein
MKKLLAALGSITTLFTPSGASADDAKPARWHLVAGAGTDAPLSVGAHARVEAPSRLRLSTSVGILPGPYVDGINAFVVAVGGYSDATADLVRSALTSSLVWRTHLGFRPVESLGLYGELGYGLVSLGGSATGSEIISGVTGRALPSSEPASSQPFDVTSTLHMLDVEVGYDLPVTEVLEVRLAVGGAFTLASSTRIAPGYAPRTPQLVKGFTDYGESYLDDVYTSYVFAPVVSVGIGYRFF